MPTAQSAVVRALLDDRTFLLRATRKLIEEMPASDARHDLVTRATDHERLVHELEGRMTANVAETLREAARELRDEAERIFIRDRPAL